MARSVPLDPAAERDLSLGQFGEQARLGGAANLSQYERDLPRPVIEEELER